MSRQKGSKQYPLWMKEQAIKMFYELGKTRAEITNELGIHDKDRVKMWLRQYRREGIESFSKPRNNGLKISKSHQTLEQKIKQLEMENELLKNFLLETERWSIKR